MVNEDRPAVVYVALPPGVDVERLPVPVEPWETFSARVNLEALRICKEAAETEQEKSDVEALLTVLGLDEE